MVVAIKKILLVVCLISFFLGRLCLLAFGGSARDNSPLLRQLLLDGKEERDRQLSSRACLQALLSWPKEYSNCNNNN